MTDLLPTGVHPGDRSVPTVPGQVPPDDTGGTLGAHLPTQTAKTRKAWNTENEEAFPVNQRSASEWTANQYTLGANAPIQIAGALKGCVSTLVWVPSTQGTIGCMISPNEGDITQGAGVTLNAGDSIELATEAAVWAGLIAGQTTGTVYVVRFYNPPGGGLGLTKG